MKKKLISLVLLAGLVLSTFAGCSGAADEETSSSKKKDKTATITLTAITGKSTTAEAIEQVQEALNKFTKSEFKTQVILQLKTEDEYLDFIESQVAAIEEEKAAAEEAAAIAKAEAKAKKEAEKLANKNQKTRSIWTTTTKAETTVNTEETQEMTRDEFDREVVKYPELEGTSLDIIFISGIDMFNDFVEKEYLASLNDELANASKILNKYIHPTVLSVGKVGSTQFAIPTNRIMGEYTYLLVDKELAAKYKFDTTQVKRLVDCEEFLDAVKANEPGYTPLSQSLEVNYLQYAAFDGSLLGSVITGDYTTASKAVPRNLLENSDYVSHYELMNKLEKGGYVGTGSKYAIEVATGYIDTPEQEGWDEKYDVIVYEKPVCDNRLYDGMFAVSAYASDVARCMEVVTLLNTDADFRNTFSFGVEGVNYEFNEDGSVHMLNNDWSMDFYHTGNTFIGAAPETLPANYGEVGKLQNIETITGPYFKWEYTVEEVDEEAEDTEENQKKAEQIKLFDEFKTLSGKYLGDFKKAANKQDYVDSVKDEMANNESIKTMLDSEGSGITAAYLAFYSAAYPS